MDNGRLQSSYGGIIYDEIWEKLIGASPEVEFEPRTEFGGY
jgi:hypothetical protein